MKKALFCAVLSMLSLLFLSAGMALAASPAAGDRLKLVTQNGYLPQNPVLVRVEVLDTGGQRDRDLWDSVATLTTDVPTLTLSTNKITLRNGLGSALVTFTGGGDFTLTATVGSLSTNRALKTLTNVPVTAVSGTLPGSATTWSNVINITASVTVPTGHTLTIQSNTLILLNGVASGTGGANLVVNGRVLSQGTEDKPVTFTCASAGLNWGQIQHSSASLASSPLSIYRHTIFTKAGRTAAIGHTSTGPLFLLNNSSNAFENCTLADNAGKIMYASGSELVFTNCQLGRSIMGPEITGTGLQCQNTWFTEMHGSPTAPEGTNDNDGIYLWGQQGGQSITLNGCVIADIQDDGIDTLGPTFTLTNCIIRDGNNFNEDAKGISVFDATMTATRCLVVNCVVGVSAKSDGPIALVKMDHCTVAGLTNGISAAFKANAAAGNIDFRVTNSIVRGPNSIRSDFSVTNITLGYCDTSEAWPGAGNLTANSLFVNAAAGDYHLQGASPCINTGDPGSPTDPDGTRTDMGFFAFRSVTNTLIPLGSVWKYLDDGSNQGTNWQARLFGDNSWASGPAQLGYSSNPAEGDEATFVNFGPDPLNKYITTYFRRAFTVSDAASYTNLNLMLLRDDGGVVYLNGTEIFRSSNMPGETIAFNTLATLSVENAIDTATVNGALPLLINGTNVIAVEIHQQAVASSDISFDFELVGTTGIVGAGGNSPPSVFVSSPADNAAFTTPVNVTINASASDTDGNVTKVEFFQNGAKLGEDASSPYSLTWSNVTAGVYQLTTVATDDKGATAASSPITINVSDPSTTTTNSLIPLGSVWKYLDNGSDQGSTWTQQGFDDTTWTNGPAQLGYGDGDEATVVGFGPDALNKYVTTYFRHKFVIDNPARVQGLIMNLLRDDGAVVHINGVEVFRIGMPAGPIGFQTFATTAGEYPFDNNIPLSTSGLVMGTNVIACEMHQGNANSSDISFELQLLQILAAETNSRPLVSLTSPPNNTTLAAPASLTLTAAASDNDGQVTNVAFYANGSKLNDDTNSPYSFNWNSVPAGVYALTAVALDNVGLSTTSSVVNLTVSTNVAPPVVLAKSPAPGALSNLTQITVTFSKAVTGVDAADLLINGAPASSVSGSGSNYTFTLVQPAYGAVSVAWAGAHGIIDVFTPPHAFDGTGAGATWSYTLLDTVPPVATTINPVPGSTIAVLTSISVLFSETVTGVDASDLRVNSAPATFLTGAGAGPYVFSFAPPALGTVLVTWAGGHGIRDASSNAFAGGSWSYILDTNATGVVISEIMYHPSSENVLDEWIELHNKGASTVGLTGWRFSSGVQFTFPNVSIPAGGYLVACANLAAFTNKFPGLTNVVGNWTGFLNNSTDNIDLDDASGNRVASVRYADEGDWAVRRRGPLDFNHRGWKWLAEHDGLGKSLELINSDLPNNLGQNWASSRTTNGTPGAANSVRTNNIAPLILEATHSPVVPRSTNTVLVTARILNESPSGLTVTLSYRADALTPPSFTVTNMHDDGVSGDGVAGDGLYSALLPAQPNNTVVEFYIRATDAQGLARFWPAPVIAAPDGIGPTGQVANALYQVDDTTYNPANNQPLYKLIMIENERLELASIPPSGDRNTDAEMNGTFISLDGAGADLHYTVGFRNRGHGSRAGNSVGIPNYRVGFRSDDPWKGMTALNLNSAEVHVQHLGSLLARKAGVAGANTIAVQLRVNNVNRASSGPPMFGSYAANEVPGGDWAAAHFPFDGNGNVYRAIRDIAPSDFSYRGENKVSYENTWFKQSNTSEDDWTDLIGMLRVVGINNATSFTTDNVRQVVNVEQWMRHIALMNLFGNNETGLNTGYNDDYFMYRGVNDPRFILTYYDLDTILGEGGSLPPNAGLFTAIANLGSGQAFDRFLNWPDFQPIYFRTLNEMLNTAFAKTNFDTMVDQALGGYVQSATIANIKSWMDGRRSFVLSQLPAITNSAPPVAAVSGAPRSPTPLTSATLTVGGPGVATYRFKLNGGSYGVETPLTTNIVLAGLSNGTNTLAVIARGTNGVWQDVTNATIRSWVVNTSWPAVRLNEVLAHNVAAVNHSGSFPDVVELFNEGGATVDLSGLRLTDDPGNPNKFTFPAVTTLAAGGYLVVYADNPDGSPGLHLGFSLDQDGEALYLFDRATNGSTVLDSVVFGLQLADLSIGRVAGGDWALTQPTFGSVNVLKPVSDPHYLKINEWLAAGLNPNPDDFIELYNTGPLPVALGGLHLTDQPIGAPTLHSIPALSFIGGASFQNFIADGSAHRADHVNFKLTLEQGEIGLTAADGAILDCVIYGPQEPGVSSGRCPDGAIGFRSLNLPTPGAPNACPFVPPTAQTVNLLTISNVWKYEQSGSDLGTTWRDTNYNDAAWPSGPALLAYETDPLPEPIRTPLTTNSTKITYYFRTHFNVGAGLAVSDLQITHVIDDGAVVYLNGAEVYRFNIPAGSVNSATLAVPSVVNADFQGPFSASIANLRTGDNVLAVEVHQSSSTSSDITFGLKLDAVVVTNSPLLAGLVINEVLANNASLEEADGHKPDWVEIYNPSSNSVDVAGLSLTDSTLTPQRWVFPAGSIVPPFGFRKVRFDPDSPTSGTNTGFGLKANGGAVYLFNRPADGGTVASSVLYGLQAADWSIGRVPNGSTNWVLTTPTFGSGNIAVAIGDPLQLKINEWMAAPGSGDDWFEIYNPNAQPVNLSGLRVSDNLATPKYQLPALSFIGSGPEAYLRLWAANGPDADFTGFNLSANGEAAGIFTEAGVLINGVSFGLQQTGVSEGRLPDGAAGIVSFPTTPTPGKSNFLPLSNVVINELIAHTDPPLEDAVEIFNPSGDDVDLSGWYLSDSQNNLLKFRIPSNTVVTAGGFVVFYEYQFNFDNPATPFSFSSAKGDEVYLSQSSAPGILTGYRAFAEFGPSENGVSFGRFPTSVGVDFTALSARTFGVDAPATTNQFRLGAGKTNSYAKVGPVVLNELMYHPPGTNDALEYVELHNILGTPVPLFDPNNTNNTWRIRKGIDFNFPLGTTLPAGGFLVLVNFDPLTDPASLAAFQSAYGTNMTLLGPYNGKLDNSGESVELQKPDAPQTIPGPDFGLVPYILVDKVNYSDTAPWPASPDGTGDALRRITAAQYGNDPVNWSGGPPTPGADNTIIGGVTNTPPVLNPIGNKSVNELTLLAFTATATDTDVPAQMLTFSLDAGAPNGASITPDGLFTWAPDETQGGSNYTVIVRVTDNGAPVRTDFESITITVNESNSAPVLTPIGSKVADEGSLVTFTATAIDGDAPAQTLTFTLAPGAPPAASITAAGVFSWTTTEADGPGVYPVTVRVSDGITNDFETITITVNEVNATPSLAPIAPQAVTEGKTLTFTATAADTDMPAQKLLFSLDPGAPAGASINPTNGVFTWTCPSGLVPGTNAVAVRVTDDGSPAASDMKTFNLVVVGPPRFTRIAVSPEAVVTVEWESYPGKTYRVQYTTDFSNGGWTDLDAGAPALGPISFATDPMGGLEHRFYRVLLVD